MPTYRYRCPFCLDEQDHVRTIAERDDAPECHRRKMERVLTAPMAFVRQDVRYESPIDGRPITNYNEHLEDLRRGDCVAYEPGIKQDQDRKQREREAQLERSVDETVEREIAQMPVRKLEKLTAELQGGLSAEPTRVTPAQRSFREA